MKRGDVCRCISDFTGMLSEEISIYKNDIVQVLSVVDRHWLEVEGGGSVGNVPSSVLVNIELPQHPRECPLFVAAADFMPSQQGDLGFARGDFVVGLNPIDEAWWCGEVFGKKGIFPLNFVWKVNKDIIEDVDRSEKPVCMQGRVKLSLRAQLPEELDLYAGDIVNITHIVDKDWYRGESNGATGIFPSGFVEILEPTSVPSLSTSVQESKLSQDLPTAVNLDNLYIPRDKENELSAVDFTSQAGHTVSQCLDVHSSLDSSITQGPSCDLPAMLSRTSAHWKTIDAEVDMDILDDDYFKQNMPGLFAQPTLNSSNEAQLIIPPLSQASASDSFSQIKPRSENIMDSRMSANNSVRSVFCHPESHTLDASNTRSVQTGNLKHRYENIADNDTSGETAVNRYENSLSSDADALLSDIQQSALTATEESSSDCVLNSLSQKVENYFASNLSSSNEPNGNILNNNNHFIKQYSTLSSPGYNEDNTGIEPYGRAIFSFKAQYPNELTFKKGDIIHLIKHVDSHWTQGRVGNAKGIFPTSYVDIIVNCLHNEEELFLARCDSLVNTSYLGHAKAEYDFEGDHPGDITMTKGDILKVIKSVDDNWVIVEAMNGLKGMCPKNYLSLLNNLAPEHEDANHQKSAEVSEGSCNRASRQIVQSSSSSRSRSTSPYDTTGIRRSYNKEDFGCIKKQEVETVLAKNIAYLDIACKSSHTEKREKESIFTEREIDVQAESSKIAVEEVAKSGNVPAIPPRLSKMPSDVAAAKPPVAPRTMILPPVPPRVKVGRVDSVQPTAFSDQKGFHSASITKSDEDSTASKEICLPDQESSSLEQIISSEAIYSKVQKPHLTGKPSKSKLQLRMSKKGNMADGTPLVRGDSANSASFPDDVSSVSIGSEGTYSSEAHNGSTSPAILPQRPAPPPPPKSFGSGFEDAEEYYSLPPEDMNGVRKEEKPVLQEDTDESQPIVEACVAVDAASSSLGNETLDEVSCSQETDVKASAKVDIRRELMQEIVTTEHEYIHDLEALIQVIRLAPTQKEAQAVDLETLMGNLTQVISVAKKLLSHLDSVAYESDENLRIGRVFLLCASDLCEVYKLYCSNHNVAAEPLLRKYTEDPTAAAFLQWVLSELQQHKIQLMDMRSVLIKPVQRVLKYPLFLDRLVSETHTSHIDYQDLVEAKSRMANVAKEINEYTKRLDLINKYRNAVDQSLQSKMQRVSMHSVAKKSARFSAIVSEKLGIMATTKDPDFDEEEAKFRCVQRAALSLVHDVKDLLKSVNARHRAELEISKAVSAILIEGAKTKEMEAILHVTLDTCNRLLQMFESFVNRRIAIPVSHLVSLCDVPERLIGKRYDKLLDFDNAQYRLDKNKDPTRTRILEEELSHAKGTYEALNTQLMVELPVFTNAGTEMLSLGIRSLVAARMYLQGHLAKLYLQLAQVPALSYSGEEDMLTQFRVKYLHQAGEFRQLSLIPAETLQRSLPRARVRGKKSLDNTTVKTATEGTKQKVLSKYPADVIYVVTEVHTPGEVMELTLYPGDHVALLKNKDPLGRTDRWFIDDGDNKGFARAACLRPLQPCDNSRAGAVNALPSTSNSAEPLPSPNPSAAPRPSTLPRAAPAPPFLERPPRYEDIFPAGTTATPRHQHIGGYNSDNRVAPPRYSLGQEFHVLPAQTPLPSKPGYASSSQSTVLESEYYTPPLDRQHSNEYNSPVSEESNIYEEIDQGGAENIDKNEVDITDSSPIYEAIEDCNHAETGDNPLLESEIDEPEFYYALYNFGGSDCTQLNLTAGQVILLIQAKSPDWWFVEDRQGNQGYVPASYLTKYT